MVIPDYSGSRTDLQPQTVENTYCLRRLFRLPLCPDVEQMYGDYSQAYLDIMDDDPNTKSYENMLPLNYSIAGREDQYKEIFKNKKNYYRKYRDMSIFAMIAVYLLSVVDAYVDAELSSFDISKDLGLRIEPAVFNFGGRGREASVGVQCNLNF